MVDTKKEQEWDELHRAISRTIVGLSERVQK